MVHGHIVLPGYGKAIHARDLAASAERTLRTRLQNEDIELVIDRVEFIPDR